MIDFLAKCGLVRRDPASRRSALGDRHVAREPWNIVTPPLVEARRLLLKCVSADSFLTQRFVICDSLRTGGIWAGAPTAVAPQPARHGWCAWGRLWTARRSPG
jgi:hypothetical protein